MRLAALSEIHFAVNLMIDGPWAAGHGPGGVRRLGKGFSRRSCAMVALNDSMAVGALAVLHERGVRVPAEVSVVGFDDMPIAADVTPALTTVRLPLAELGARAMTLALHPAADRERVETLPAELVRRDSLGPVPSRPVPA